MNWPLIATLALFGVWSLCCLLLGMWLMHRKQTYQSPMPDFQIIHDILRKPDADATTTTEDAPMEGVHYQL